MSAVLSAATRKRIIAAIDLAARPGTEGERQAAVAAIGRLVLGEADAIRAMLTARPVERKLPELGTWRTTCAKLQTHRHLLRGWERGFVDDLPKFRRLSVRQRYCLNEIARRVLPGGAA